MDTQERQDLDRSRTLLGLLESLGKDGTRSQRSIATEFGVAVGLVNAYLKTCVKKGYVKVRRLPSRRYAYLLTPSGFTEKARLSLIHLSNELERFRRARAQYSELLRLVQQHGWNQVVFLGACELAEIAALCALEAEMTIVAIVDASGTTGRFVGIPVVASLDLVTAPFDGAILTDVTSPASVFHSACEKLGVTKVLAPDFYGFGQRPPDEAREHVL